MHILTDQDGVLADWGLGWDNHLNERYAHVVSIPRTKDQRSFNLKLNLTDEEAAIVDEIFNHPGFYKTLQPMEGAIEGYRKMIEAGNHVQIATSPWWTNNTCLQDKADWVEKNLGADARRQMIMTSDKTTIHADFLIDDKPEIIGHYGPEWEQVVFTQPYNLEVSTRFRLNGWHEIEDTLESMYSSLYSPVIF